MERRKVLFFLFSFAIFLSAVFFSPHSFAQTSACTSGSVADQISCLKTLIARLKDQLADVQRQLASDLHDGSRVKTLVNLRIRNAPTVSGTSLDVVRAGSLGTITCNGASTCPASADGYTWWRIDWDSTGGCAGAIGIPCPEVPPTGFSVQGTSEADYLEAVSGESLQSCNFNGQTISHGSSVTAYQSPEVTAPNQCVSEARRCNNGTLGGSYQNSSCTVKNPTATSSSPVSNLFDPGIAKEAWAALIPPTLNIEPSCKSAGNPIWYFNTLSVDGTPCSGSPMGLQWTKKPDGKYKVALALDNTKNSQRYNTTTRNYFGIQTNWPVGSKDILYVPNLTQLTVTAHIKINPDSGACDDPTIPLCVEKQSPQADLWGKTLPDTEVFIGIPMYDETNKRNLWIEVSPFWTKKAVLSTGPAQSTAKDQYLFWAEGAKEEFHRIKASHPLVQQAVLAAGQEGTYTIDMLKLIKGLGFGHEFPIDWNKVHLGDVYVGVESFGWTLTSFEVSDIDLRYDLTSRN